MRITKELLESRKACSDQVNKFAALFPDGVTVTAELCERYAQEFYFNWAAENLLTAPAWAEYERVEATALAEYKRVKALAFFKAFESDNLRLAGQEE